MASRFVFEFGKGYCVSWVSDGQTHGPIATCQYQGGRNDLVPHAGASRNLPDCVAFDNQRLRVDDWETGVLGQYLGEGKLVEIKFTNERRYEGLSRPRFCRSPLDGGWGGESLFY